MLRTMSFKRYARFFEQVALGELGLILFVSVVFSVMGARSIHEIGIGFLVAGFGVSLLGAASVMRSIQNSVPPEGRFMGRQGLRNVDWSVSAAMNVSPETYRFFWVMVAISAMAFGLGAVLVELS